MGPLTKVELEIPDALKGGKFLAEKQAREAQVAEKIVGTTPIDAAAAAAPGIAVVSVAT